MSARPALAPRHAVIGALAAAVFFLVFVRQADWHVVAGQWRQAMWTTLALAVTARLMSIAVSARRWQALLAPVGHVPFVPSLMTTFIGAAAGSVLPMQAAEFVRPTLVSRRFNMQLSMTAAAMVTEWVLDGVAIVSLFVAALFWLRVDRGGAMSIRAASVALAAIVAVVTSLRWLSPRLTSLSMASPMARCLPLRLRRAVVNALRGFGAGLRTLQARRSVMRLGGYSALVSILTAVSAWLTLAAFDLHLSAAAGCLLLGLITLAGMIPTPGAIGGFDAVCQFGLVTAFHVEPTRAVAAVLGLHAVLYLPAALVGGVCLAAWPFAHTKVHT